MDLSNGSRKFWQYDCVIYRHSFSNNAKEDVKNLSHVKESDLEFEEL